VLNMVNEDRADGDGYHDKDNRDNRAPDPPCFSALAHDGKQDDEGDGAMIALRARPFNSSPIHGKNVWVPCRICARGRSFRSTRGETEQ